MSAVVIKHASTKLPNIISTGKFRMLKDREILHDVIFAAARMILIFLMVLEDGIMVFVILSHCLSRFVRK